MRSFVVSHATRQSLSAIVPSAVRSVAYRTSSGTASSTVVKQQRSRAATSDA